jgi:hypothetical protein
VGVTVVGGVVARVVGTGGTVEGVVAGGEVTTGRATVVGGATALGATGVVERARLAGAAGSATAVVVVGAAVGFGPGPPVVGGGAPPATPGRFANVEGTEPGGATTTASGAWFMINAVTIPTSTDTLMPAATIRPRAARWVRLGRPDGAGGGTTTGV